MPKFNDFYNQVIQLKQRYPDANLAAFSDENLEKLKQLVDWCDHVDYYILGTEAQIVHDVFALGDWQKRLITADEARMLLIAMSIKLDRDAHHQFTESLNGELFAELHEAASANTLGDEEMRNRRLSDLRSRWREQKHYAGAPVEALTIMKYRLQKLKAYLAVGALELANQSQPLQGELQQLITDGLVMLGNETERLVQAALTRLAMVSATDLNLLLNPKVTEKHDFTPVEGDVCEKMAESLGEVGLSREYVTQLQYLTQSSASLTEVSIDELNDFVKTKGSEAQKKQLTELFDRVPEQPLPDIPMDEKAAVFPKEANKLVEASLILEEIIPDLDELDRGMVPPDLQNRMIKLSDLIDMKGFEQLANYNRSVGSFTHTVPPRSHQSQEDIEVEKEASSPQPRTMVAATCLENATDLISFYLTLNPEQTSSHSRHGRAQHIEGLMKAVQAEDDPAQFSSQYNSIVALLFMHYQSIDDSDSQLSCLIEKSIAEMLGFNLGRFPREAYNDYITAYNQASERRDDKGAGRFSQMKSTLFGRSTASDKINDPLFLFIKNHIIQNVPGVRDLLFERDPKTKQFVLNKVSAEIVSQLEEKDKQETAFFKGEPLSSEKFDEIFRSEPKLDVEPPGGR